VADGGFLGAAELREAAVVLLETGLGDQEQRVVAEVAGAARGGQDAAAGDALALEGQRAIGARDGEGANEARAAALARQAGQGFEQLGVVACVVGRLARVARRENARRAPQGIDLQTRIVGQRPQAAGLRRAGGLLGSVEREGGLVLVDGRDPAHLVGRHDLDREGRQQELELGAFLGVLRGEDEAHASGNRPAIIARLEGRCATGRFFGALAFVEVERRSRAEVRAEWR